MVCIRDPHTGARETKVFDSKSEAEVYGEERRSKFKLRLETAAKTKFDKIAEEYEVEIQRTCCPEWQKTLLRYVKMLKDAGLTDLSVDTAVPLVRRIATNMKTKRGEPVSSKTRNDFLLRCRGIANFAIERGLLASNPFLRIKYEDEEVEDKAVFTLDEIGKLVDPKHADHPFYRAFACLAYTGMRSKEIRLMDWSWIRSKQGLIEIPVFWEHTVIDRKSNLPVTKKFRVAKSGTGRYTRLMEELAAILQADRQPAGAIFPKFVLARKETFIANFYAYLEHCGVPINGRTPHSMRHVWTCLMLATGENSSLVRQYAGHSEQEMQSHYARKQEFYRREVARTGWERGELRLQDFSTNGKMASEESSASPLRLPASG